MEGAGGDDGKKGRNYYEVLGLRKSCTAVELRNAYKKLALRWHPDRCSAPGNSKFVEEAKKKFQNIQEAYSVLSDGNKRFLYDVGVYDDDDDDDENGMGDFLNEMVAMMSQTKPTENGNDSFEDLQSLFEEMFQGDINSFGCSSQNVNSNGAKRATTSTTTSTATTATYMSYCDSSENHKRNITEMNCGNNIGPGNFNGFGTRTTHFQSFCLGTGGGSASREGESKRRSSVRNSSRVRR